MEAETPFGDALALPIDARVLQHAWRKILDDRREAFFTAQAIKKRELALHLGGLICRRRARRLRRRIVYLGLFGSFLTGAFSGAGQLLIFRHALAGALIGIATAGSKEIFIVLFGRARVAARNRAQSCAGQ